MSLHFLLHLRAKLPGTAQIQGERGFQHGYAEFHIRVAAFYHFTIGHHRLLRFPGFWGNSLPENAHTRRRAGGCGDHAKCPQAMAYAVGANPGSAHRHLGPLPSYVHVFRALLEWQEKLGYSTKLLGVLGNACRCLFTLLFPFCREYGELRFILLQEFSLLQFP